MKKTDVIIIGAGAAGLMCAIRAGSRGRRVTLLDLADKVGKKILMSGGGHCNFTNYFIDPENYLSSNPHFCKSALGRYTQWDFIHLVEKHQIAYHEKKLGQLFCDNKAKEIVQMLLSESADVGATIYNQCAISKVSKCQGRFTLETNRGEWQCDSLVIATGGLSIPTMGATGFGYEVARQFGLAIIPQRAALVPFTLHPELLAQFKGLSGTAVDIRVECNGKTFRENMLFTHRGLSGPAILQISSYWTPGDRVHINLLPDKNLFELLKSARQERPKVHLNNLLSSLFTRKLALRLCEIWFSAFYQQPVAQLSISRLQAVAQHLQHWQFTPAGTEGYRTAEVTLGGISTDEISSKTFEVRKVPGLYFIGEVLDVSGQLGGFNFQWAWASGQAAGQAV